MNDFVMDATDGDLYIENGDLVIAESDLQHQEDILRSDKGHNKEFPLMGVGLEEFLNDDNIIGMVNEVRRQFKADGMTVNNVLYSLGKLEVDANY